MSHDVYCEKPYKEKIMFHNAYNWDKILTRCMSQRVNIYIMKKEKQRHNYPPLLLQKIKVILTEGRKAIHVIREIGKNK